MDPKNLKKMLRVAQVNRAEVVGLDEEHLETMYPGIKINTDNCIGGQTKNRTAKNKHR